MKKIKALIALFVMVLIVTGDCVAAEAAVNELTVTSDGITVRELSRDEMEAVASDLAVDVVAGETSEITSTTADYTAYEYSETFNFSLGDTLVAQADAVCIVWHYTDGKVHLYQRTITVSRLITYDASRTYGRIVNTDGSLSYTTGDRVHLYGDMTTWNFAIDFRVTPTDAAFNCYEV